MPLGNTIYAVGKREEGSQGSLMNQTVVWVQKPLNYYVTVKREYQSKTNNAIASPGLKIWRLKEGSLFHFKKSIVLIIDSFSSVFHCWSYPLSLIINKAMKGKQVGVNSLFSHIHKSALFPIFIVVVCLYHCIINKARSRKHIVYIHLSSTLNACNRCTLNSPSSISTLRSPEKLAWLEIF